MSIQPKPIVAAASPWLILQWILSGELWRIGVGEDPHWGERPANQVAIHTTIYEMANHIKDPTVRKQVQTAAATGMAAITNKMVAG